MKQIFSINILIFLLMFVLSACGGSKKKNAEAPKNKSNTTIEIPKRLSREEFINKHFAGIEFVETDITRAATMIRRGNNNLKIVGDFPRVTINLEHKWYWDNDIRIDQIDLIDLSHWDNLVSVLNDKVNLDLSEFTALFRDINPEFQRVSLYKAFYYVSGIILPPNYIPEPQKNVGGTTVLGKNNYNPDQHPSFTIVLNEGIEEIPDGMFCYEERNLNIYLPSSIKRIGSVSFKGSSIESFVVPAAVIEIDDEAFNDCGRLQKLYFEEGSQLQRIGNSAFQLPLTGLTGVRFYFISNSIYLPDSVTAIGNYAFRGQYQLPALHISKNSKLEVIEKRAFEQTQITNVYLPETIKEIGEYAFQRKDTIYYAYKPETKENIAFEYAGMTSITIASSTPPKISESSIPNNVKDIFVPSGKLDLYKDTWFDYEFTFNNQLKPIKE